MSKEERPLPVPPKTPFGRNRGAEHDESTPLMSDRIAAAIAEGRIEEFLKTEFPDNEHARALASMMMGLTGLSGMAGMAPGLAPGLKPATTNEASTNQAASKDEAATSGEVPEDVVRAIQSADVAGLTDILRREFQKRSQGNVSTHAPIDAPQSEGLPEKEKEILDSLIKIAGENSVSVDWLISRALKLYVDEYSKTGRL